MPNERTVPARGSRTLATACTLLHPCTDPFWERAGKKVASFVPRNARGRKSSKFQAPSPESCLKGVFGDWGVGLFEGGVMELLTQSVLQRDSGGGYSKVQIPSSREVPSSKFRKPGTIKIKIKAYLEISASRKRDPQPV